jgi:uncharacterized protein
MNTQIFVNLPVKDLNRSIDFFTGLGYTFNQQFTDENATCMVVSENIFVMLLVEKFFQTFVPGQIADAKQVTESIICLSAPSKQKVDETIATAVGLGATLYKEPQDHGFMYGHSFQDLDGHLWEVMWMDANAASQPARMEQDIAASN